MYYIPLNTSGFLLPDMVLQPCQTARAPYNTTNNYSFENYLRWSEHLFDPVSTKVEHNKLHNANKVSIVV